MKKFLLLVVLLVISQLNSLSAQTLRPSPDSLFYAPDTVCINQPVTLKSGVFNALSYYWGFCSGYLRDAPTGVNLGNHFKFHIPTNIDIVYDSGLYYGFVINAQSRTFERLNFGNSLSNAPTVTNFDSMTSNGHANSGLPLNPTSLFILKDTVSNTWFIFVAGGFTRATSTLSRIDFGPHLGNPKPNIANFGNYQNMLNFPKGLFIAQNGDYNWFGYLLNEGSNELIRLDFAFNVSNTPLMENLGNVTDPTGTPLLNLPSDAAAIRDHGQWYYFVTNVGSNSVLRINLGTGLDTDITASTPPGALGEDLGNFDFRINDPSSITIDRDCGELHAYITDSSTSQLVGIQMASAMGAYYAVDYNTIGGMYFPSSISSVLRNNDNLYAFIANPKDSTLTRIDFQQCHNSSIPSYTEVAPPVYTYNTPGIYNLYFVVNHGLPSMEVDCKPITVLGYPPIYMNNDTTVCEGDTIRLYAISNLADSIRWQTGYAIDTTNLYTDSVRVYPDYSTSYKLTIYYPFGCIVDTTVKVHVSKVHADAGPDRWIKDGENTTIGGPYTSFANTINLADSAYDYHWFPFQYLTDTAVTNPVASPPYDYTYYLTVTEHNDTFKCQAKDTVVVHIRCLDFAVPNAFAPNSESSLTNGFGILNKEIIKLNYFRVYDRWGELVYETNNVADKWDGTYNGKPAPVDVYVWVADAFCASGKEINKSGNVTLIR
jgi:gliding motility-associated-like protein